MKITGLFVPFADELQLAATPRVSNPPLVEWTSAWGDLFFRVKGADPQIVWCVLGVGGRAQRTISREFAKRTFFRVVPLGDGDDWVLVRPQCALVISPNRKRGAHWKLKADFISNAKSTTWLSFSPLLETWVPSTRAEKELAWMSQSLKWFENWLKETADEDLSIARTVANLDDKERFWLPLCRNSQVWRRWEQLVPALQRLCASSENTDLMEWHLYGFGRSKVELSQNGWHKDELKKPPVRDLVTLLEHCFPLCFDARYWRDINGRGGNSNHHAPTFVINSPTQHEKLEAALLWRDFGREIGESERVEAALAQLLSD